MNTISKDAEWGTFALDSTVYGVVQASDETLRQSPHTNIYCMRGGPSSKSRTSFHSHTGFKISETIEFFNKVFEKK